MKVSKKDKKIKKPVKKEYEVKKDKGSVTKKTPV